jgi:hypothetical protein
LSEKTGRESKAFARREVELTDEDYIRWNMDPPMLMGDAEERQMQLPEWQYDNQTWAAMNSPEFAANSMSTDPAEWGLDLMDIGRTFYENAEQELSSLQGDAQEAFRQRIAAILDAQDTKGMGEYLGRDWLFSIARRKERPEPPYPVPSRRERGLTFEELEAIGTMPCPFREPDQPLTDAQLKLIMKV